VGARSAPCTTAMVRKGSARVSESGRGSFGSVNGADAGRRAADRERPIPGVCRTDVGGHGLAWWAPPSLVSMRSLVPLLPGARPPRFLLAGAAPLLFAASFWPTLSGPVRPGRRRSRVVNPICPSVSGQARLDDCDVLRAGRTRRLMGAAGWRRRRRWGRSCGRSRSDTSAILDALLRRALSGRGRLARARATRVWSLTSTASSARCAAAWSRAPPTATRSCSATT
jgi:hypothetical protein